MIAPRDRPAIVAATYWWNRPTLRALLSGPAGPPRFCWSIDDAISRAIHDRADLYVWASRLEDRHIARADDACLPLWRIEDGFLRSIGLGAGFVTAASLAFDRRGIYYDASTSSDLEHALEHDDTTAAEIETAALIRARILKARLSKYNLRNQPTAAAELTHLRQQAGDRKIVLVPGQVADDASILKSVSTTIDTAASENVNADLLAEARARHPEAFLVFKPHPDVASGLRRGKILPATSARLADRVVDAISILDLLDISDHVETISSLAGFEALLRGKPVTCHGAPFYAGWGLTEDCAPMPRRTRRRTLNELIAFSLTRYTRHVHPYTRLECSCLDLIEGLIRQRDDKLHYAKNALLRRAAWSCERLRL